MGDDGDRLHCLPGHQKFKLTHYPPVPLLAARGAVKHDEECPPRAVLPHSFRQ